MTTTDYSRNFPELAALVDLSQQPEFLDKESTRTRDLVVRQIRPHRIHQGLARLIAHLLLVLAGANSHKIGQRAARKRRRKPAGPPELTAPPL